MTCRINKKKPGSMILTVAIAVAVAAATAGGAMLSASWISKDIFVHKTNVASIYNSNYTVSQPAQNIISKLNREEGWMWRLFFRDNLPKTGEVISDRMIFRDMVRFSLAHARTIIANYAADQENEVFAVKRSSDYMRKYEGGDGRTVFAFPKVRDIPKQEIMMMRGLEKSSLKIYLRHKDEADGGIYKMVYKKLFAADGDILKNRR